jgi:hypothetical protein
MAARRSCGRLRIMVQVMRLSQTLTVKWRYGNVTERKIDENSESRRGRLARFQRRNGAPYH